MDFGNFTITKREIIFSIVIIAIMLTLGFIIHGSIDNAMMLKHQEYNTALRIENDADIFQYGMSTNVGNAYVHGTLEAVDPVTFDEIGGQYSYVKKVKGLSGCTQLGDGILERLLKLILMPMVKLKHALELRHIGLGIM